MNQRIKHKQQVFARAKHHTHEEAGHGEVKGAKGTDAKLEPTTSNGAAPLSTTTPIAQGGEGHVSAAQKKALGLLDDEPSAASGKHAGVKAAKVGLEALAPKKKKPTRFMAGVATMVLGLTLLSTAPNMAKAQDWNPAQGGSPIAVQMESRAYRQNLPELGESVRVEQGKIPQAALDRFYVAMERALRLDARGVVLDMHEGRNPYFLSDGTRSLNNEQQKELLRAAKDLVMEIPIGALSPELIGVARDALTARGQSTAGLENKKLGDLGDIGRDIATDIVKDLREAHPAVFNTLGAVAAVALGTAASLEGTDVLRSIGLRPDLRLRFLDGALQTRVRAEWDARFTNPKLSAGLYGNIPLGSFQGQLGLSVDARGPSFGKLQLSGLTLSGTSVGTLENGGLLGLTGQAQINGSGHVSSATLGLSYAREPWTVGVGATWTDGNGQNHGVSGSLSVGYRPSRNLDVFLLGTVNPGGDRFLGVGARIGF